MERKLIGVLIVLGCIVSLGAIWGNLAFSQVKGDEASQSAPDFSLSSPDGEQVKLSDFKGKVIILDFWATRCPPCRREIPDFIKLQDKYRDKGLVIIGVSLDRGNIETVKNFCRDEGVNYPIVMGDFEVTESYGGIMYIPTTFVIGRNGNIVKKFIGFTSMGVFEGEVEKLL